MKRINRPEPPRVHAQSHHNDETGELYYEYNGRRVVEVKMPEGVKYRFRFYSEHGVLHTVNIWKDGYSGSVTERPLGKAPVEDCFDAMTSDELTSFLLN